MQQECHWRLFWRWCCRVQQLEVLTKEAWVALALQEQQVT
jgi:hypothetical protein